MGVAPIVRHMILCDHWDMDAENHNRVNIYGLMSYLSPVDTPPYPATKETLCVFLVLTEVRGIGTTFIRCLYEETGEIAFQTASRALPGSSDPVGIHIVAFQIHDWVFPISGVYLVQFWYNDDMVHECSLRLRCQP